MTHKDTTMPLHVLMPMSDQCEEIFHHSSSSSGTDHDSCTRVSKSYENSLSTRDRPNEKARFYRRYRARPPNWKDFYTVLYYLLYAFGTVYLWRIVYKNLPLRTTSRVVGRLAKIRLPRWLRGPVFRCYGWFFRANLEEIEYFDDLSRYHSLADFFQRSLRPTARIIDQAACLVSPADGRVLSCGRIEAGHLEQVKGLFYTLRGLLGPNTWTELEKISNGGTSLNSNLTSGLHPVRSAVDLTVQHRICVTGRGLDYLPVYPSTNVQVNKTSTPVLGRTRQTARSSCAASRSLRLEDYLYAQSLLLGPSGSQFPCDGSSSCLESNSPVWEDDQITDLYHLLVYLAPGDYHRFHSPTDWSIQMRRHFPGKLYSVAPPFVRQLDRLYCTNERVIYVGRWRYGFFAYVAVGATNVGSISVYKDPDLVTNMPIRPKQLARIWPMIQRGPDAETTRTDRGSEADFRDLHFTEQIAQTKGELFGQFNFGSTVILVFEAPVDSFQFTVNLGSRIKVGQAVGSVS